MPAFDKGVSIINTQLSIIPNFEQRQTNVDLNNVRQRQSSAVIFNVDLHTLSHVETTLWIWPLKKEKK